MSLAEKLTQPPRRERVVAECCNLIDEEVKSKGGLSGMAVKGAYAVVKTVKPRFVSEVVDAMLDDWVARLEPFYADWQQTGGTPPLPDFLAARRGDVAEQLLGVTDSRAAHAKNANVKKMYEKLRPSAKKHVEEAIPRLGRFLQREMAV